MTTFCRQARRHLAPAGWLLIFFGTSGNLGYLQQLFTEERFDAEVVASDTLAKDRLAVEYFTFRVTRMTRSPYEDLPKGDRSEHPNLLCHHLFVADRT